jgi:hypothetical protein
MMVVVIAIAIAILMAAVMVMTVVVMLPDARLMMFSAGIICWCAKLLLPAAHCT